MIDNMSSLPFDGIISRFLIEEAPADLKALILEGDKKDILDEVIHIAVYCRKKIM